MCQLKKVLVVTLIGAGLTGCSTFHSAFTYENVKPWEKGILAKDSMALSGDPLDSYVDGHIYFSKEASTGGTSVGGGGCGCN
ncbi:DUF4266 domain-containing protein [Gynuella sp.]|uniref:DUF4266 domain-containing protein n=1 Tax=Gynuella sp. TaxID=2969146 RepID=UPI003D151CAB